jgi:hypothetical protein
MAKQAHGARQEIEAKLALGESLWRAARIDAAGRDEALWKNKKIGEAERVLRTVVSKCESLVSDHRTFQMDLALTLTAYSSLATILAVHGKHDEERALQNKALTLIDEAHRA